MNKASRWVVLLVLAGPVVADPEPLVATVLATGSVPDGLGIPEGVAPERLRWNRMPLTVSLPINKERLVTFPEDVRVGFPPELTTQQLRTQIVDGTIYWTALQAFPVHRIQIQAIGSGDIYLVDLSASADATSTTPIEVLDASPQTARRSAEPPKLKSAEREKSETKPPDYAGLTRMAAQQLYAPERLLKTLEGVHRAPVGRRGTDRLFHGLPVSAEPLIAWRSGNVYVTAVRLGNQGFDDILLDPRTLRGPWRTATFQHSRLFGKGDADGRDVTAAYLISDRPFEEVLDGR
jgi:integrating conjugative element protein (TIGR03749 family)